MMLLLSEWLIKFNDGFGVIQYKVLAKVSVTMDQVRI